LTPFADLAFGLTIGGLTALVGDDLIGRRHGLADPAIRFQRILLRLRSLPRALSRGSHAARICDRPERQLRYSPTPIYREVIVVNAYILIQTEVGKAAQVAKEVSGIKGVAAAEDVTGPYDVIVRAEARNVDELGKLVVAKIQAVEGITRTLTCPVVHL
jgi:DNA-binding Lrp family transcriptional regulator